MLLAGLLLAATAAPATTISGFTDGQSPDPLPREPGHPTPLESVAYSTLLGGSGGEGAYGVVTDGFGFTYVVGWTNSPDFPATPGAYDGTFGGGLRDAFVAKLSPAGDALMYATYLGGSDMDEGMAVALAPDGSVYVSGQTRSLDFPLTPDALNSTFPGESAGFLAILDATGSVLEYASYLPGAMMTNAGTLVLDAAGKVYLTGIGGEGFPATPGAFDTSLNGTEDAILAKLDLEGRAYEYATYLGGDGVDRGYGLAVDPGGRAYAVGFTDADFPVTGDAVQPAFAGGYDIFVARLSSGGDALEYATFFGGWNWDVGNAVALDAAGAVYVTGFTRSSDFPTTPEAFDRTFWGNVSDAFAFKLAPLGTGLAYSTFLGGTGHENGNGIVVDGTGAAYLTGSAQWSTDFPVTPDAFDSAEGGFSEGFMLRLSPDGSSVEYGSYLGGSEWDDGEMGHGIARTCGASYVAGITSAPDFPTTPGALQRVLGDTFDAFVVMLGARSLSPIAEAGPDWQSVRNATVRFDGSASYDPEGEALGFSWVQVGGPPVSLLDPLTATPSFVPTERGTYGFRVTVIDGTGCSSTDTVFGTVVNQPPNADAGPQRTVPKRTWVALDGTESSDPDGDELAFDWTQTAGPPIGLTGRDTATPAFAPPRAGVYEFRLTVEDGFGLTATATVRITATNAPPTADAGADQVAWGSARVTLDGSRSSDPDDDALAYDWVLLSGPDVVVEGPTTARPTFTPVEPGRYTFRLRVADGDGGVSEDTVVVDVLSAPPVPVDVRTNLKPFLAAVFAAVLAVACVWSMRRERARAAISGGTVRASSLLLVPFVAAELLTGIISWGTGYLSIPPGIGVGTVVDVGILLAGLATCAWHARRRPRDASAGPSPR